MILHPFHLSFIWLDPAEGGLGLRGAEAEPRSQWVKEDTLWTGHQSTQRQQTNTHHSCTNMETLIHPIHASKNTHTQIEHANSTEKGLQSLTSTRNVRVVRRTLSLFYGFHTTNCVLTR